MEERLLEILTIEYFIRRFLVEREETMEMIADLYKKYPGNICSALENEFVIDRREYFDFLSFFLTEDQMQKLYKRYNGRR